VAGAAHAFPGSPVLVVPIAHRLHDIGQPHRSHGGDGRRLTAWTAGIRRPRSRAAAGAAAGIRHVEEHR
jgi:hypothetical protein